MTNTGIRLFGIAWWRSHKNIFIKVAMEECIVDVQLKKMPMTSCNHFRTHLTVTSLATGAKVS
jgi:hypothetical protein